jgi:hypothetical protein
MSKEEGGYVTLYVSKQYIKLDLRFGPQPILNLSGLN